MTTDNENIMDETDVNLRAYLESLGKEHLRAFDSSSA
jgi:hypothetical protein